MAVNEASKQNSKQTNKHTPAPSPNRENKTKPCKQSGNLTMTEAVITRANMFEKTLQRAESLERVQRCSLHIVLKKKQKKKHA